MRARMPSRVPLHRHGAAESVEDAPHPPVVGAHPGPEGVDAVGGGVVAQALDEGRPEAEALPAVGHGGGEPGVGRPSARWYRATATSARPPRPPRPPRRPQRPRPRRHVRGLTCGEPAARGAEPHRPGVGRHPGDHRGDAVGVVLAAQPHGDAAPVAQQHPVATGIRRPQRPCGVSRRGRGSHGRPRALRAIPPSIRRSIVNPTGSSRAGPMARRVRRSSEQAHR